MGESPLRPKRHLVEFYDREYLENVVSLLYGDYDDVTYVYFRSQAPRRQDREGLERFVARKIGVQPRFLEVPEDSIPGTLAAMRARVEAGGPFDFDITGGSSIFVAAAGALFARLGGEQVSLHEFNVAEGAWAFHCPDGSCVTPRQRPLPFTIEDMLGLQGIKVLREGRYPLAREGLREEIHRLWSAVRGELRSWNTFCSTAQKYTHAEGCLQGKKWMNDQQYAASQPAVAALKKAGILSHWQEKIQKKDRAVSFRLNVPDTAGILYEKAGNLLEMLTYASILDSGCFTDCRTGIELDREGADKRRRSGPYNEIDVLALRGHIPYFISCKNTHVENDYLYEILTMTRYYGGAYAVPVLVTSVPSRSPLRARAKEMGIRLIDDVHEMSAEVFAQTLCRVLGGDPGNGEDPRPDVCGCRT